MGFFVSLGRLGSHSRDLWLLELSSVPSGPHHAPHQPETLITAGHLGNDVAAIQTALGLARVLASRYGKDNLITQVSSALRGHRTIFLKKTIAFS